LGVELPQELKFEERFFLSESTKEIFISPSAAKIKISEPNFSLQSSRASAGSVILPRSSILEKHVKLGKSTLLLELFRFSIPKIAYKVIHLASLSPIDNVYNYYLKLCGQTQGAFYLLVFK